MVAIGSAAVALLDTVCSAAGGELVQEHHTFTITIRTYAAPADLLMNVTTAGDVTCGEMVGFTN